MLGPRRLFTLTDAPAGMIFKGGTSLSKVFNAIGRFSEDVDLSFDRADLGFGGDNDPGRAPSKKQTKQRLKMLKEACQASFGIVFSLNWPTLSARHWRIPASELGSSKPTRKILTAKRSCFIMLRALPRLARCPLGAIVGPSERTRRPCGRIFRRIIEVANRHEQRSAQGLRHLGSKSHHQWPCQNGP